LYRVTCARSSAPMSTRDIADAFARHPPRATPGLGNLASPQTRFLIGDEKVPRSSRRVKQSKRWLFDSLPRTCASISFENSQHRTKRQDVAMASKGRGVKARSAPSIKKQGVRAVQPVTE